MSNLQVFITLGALALGTLLTRFIPFWFFPEHKPIPKILMRMGDRLPYASLGMLVVYALKDVKVLESSYGLPELLSLITITLIHSWKKDTLLSITGGVFTYLVLVNVVFK